MQFKAKAAGGGRKNPCIRQVWSWKRSAQEENFTEAVQKLESKVGETSTMKAKLTEEDAGVAAGGVAGSRAQRFVHTLKYLKIHHLADNQADWLLQGESTSQEAERVEEGQEAKPIEEETKGKLVINSKMRAVGKSLEKNLTKSSGQLAQAGGKAEEEGELVNTQDTDAPPRQRLLPQYCAGKRVPGSHSEAT